MKITFKKTVACLLAAAVLCAAPVFSDKAFGEYAEEKGEYIRKKMERLTKELDLTDEQKAEMQKLREESWAEKKELNNQLKDARKELGEELKKPSSDRGRINNIATKMKNLQGKMIDDRIDHFLAVKEILTDEQFQKFQDLQQERQKKFRKKISEKRGERRPHKRHR